MVGRKGDRGEGDRLIFELRPALPDAFLVPGREYWLTNLPYRGARLTVGYRVADREPDSGGLPTALEILVSTGMPTRCQVQNVMGTAIWASDGASTRHTFPGARGGAYRVRVAPVLSEEPLADEDVPRL